MRQLTHNFGERLVEHFSERGVTPEQVAQKSGLSEVLVADLITGKQILTADVAFTLASALELSPLVLLELQRESCLEARDREDREGSRPSLAA